MMAELSASLLVITIGSGVAFIFIGVLAIDESLLYAGMPIYLYEIAVSRQPRRNMLAIDICGMKWIIIGRAIWAWHYMDNRQ